MSFKNITVIEQIERGWRTNKSRQRSKKFKKKYWSKLNRLYADKIGYNGYEF